MALPWGNTVRGRGGDGVRLPQRPKRTFRLLPNETKNSRVTSPQRLKSVQGANGRQGRGGWRLGRMWTMWESLYSPPALLYLSHKHFEESTAKLES